MLHQIRRDFATIAAAKAAFEADGDSAHLDTIDHIALRVLHENKLLTAASKTHLQRWRAYVAEQQLPRHGASHKLTPQTSRAKSPAPLRF